MVRAFLKLDQSLIPLSPKITTIGQSGCDLVIQSSDIDQQHAIIESVENGFILQDLNSNSGTYINDCRIQNAAVRLASGDNIRFGIAGVPYEFCVDGPPVQQYQPSVLQQVRCSQPITVLPDASVRQENQSLPIINAGLVPQSFSTPAISSAPVKPPVSLRRRPISADTRQFVLQESPSSPALRPQTLYSRSGNIRSSIYESDVNGWTGSKPSRSETNSPTPEAIIQDKESKISQLTDEISRLTAFEAESLRKDQLVSQLRQELQLTQKRLQDLKANPSQEIIMKLRDLENEVAHRSAEVNGLKEQLANTQVASNAAQIRDNLNSRLGEITHMKSDLERTRKDKDITAGLVTQLQKDMSSKDTTISRLTRELESVRKDLLERDTQISALGTKVQRMKHGKQIEEERDAKERELAHLRQRFKNAENKLQEQSDLIQRLKKDGSQLRSDLQKEKEDNRSRLQEAGNLKAQFADLQRAERAVRVDLEQAMQKTDRLRNRLIQVAYSVPGVRAPTTEITDDQLIERLKKSVEERVDMSRKMKDLGDAAKAGEKAERHRLENQRKLVKFAEDSQVRLDENNRWPRNLRQEIQLLESMQLDSELDWARAMLMKDWNHQLLYLENIENALKFCLDSSLSSHNAADHIRALQTRHEQLLSEFSLLKNSNETMGDEHSRQQRAALEQLKEQMDQDFESRLEACKTEGEQKLKRAVDEAKAIESEQRLGEVENEKHKQQHLYGQIEELRVSLVNKDKDLQEQRKTAEQAVGQIDQYKTRIEKLSEEVNILETTKRTEIEALNERISSLKESNSRDVGHYRDQVRQHSLTICAMEERLHKVMKKNKDLVEEDDKLKKHIAELKARSRSPQRPKSPVLMKTPSEISNMEHTIISLRNDNADFVKQIKDLETTVFHLQNDLAGAHARLSDITGELDETQKERLEQSERLSSQKQAELLDVRQQLAKMSQVVDKQEEEINRLNAELGKQTASMTKLKSRKNEQEAVLRDLEDQLSAQQSQQKQQLEVHEQEGRASIELSALGAQCCGERHEQIINRQREALAELRHRIKELEKLKPPLPTHDQALQHVILLKKELAELRAKQALQAEIGHQNATTLEQEVNRTRGLYSHGQLEMERQASAHSETRATLEASEESFLTLLRAVASCLEMEHVSGLRSMLTLPPDEKERLITEREDMCDTVAGRIKILKERVNRKDEMLEDYERNLAKLRQFEELSKQKSAQIDRLVADVRARSEECDYLRDNLQRTKDLLNQEKRLNVAIKERKKFAIETDLPIQKYSSHKCPSPNAQDKEDLKIKASKEKMRRKQFEISNLRAELGERTDELLTTQRKLKNLESSLGIGPEKDFTFE